jgi:hypothetical protein
MGSPFLAATVDELGALPREHRHTEFVVAKLREPRALRRDERVKHSLKEVLTCFERTRPLPPTPARLSKAEDPRLLITVADC